MESHPLPTDIQLHQQSRVLEIAFDDGARFNLPTEYLRVYSPSAEVLYKLGRGWQPLWLDYLSRLRDAGRERRGPDPFEVLQAAGKQPSLLPH